MPMNLIPPSSSRPFSKSFLTTVGLFALAVALLLTQIVSAQKQEVVWSPQEKPIAEQIHGLRKLPDDVRARTTKELALQIRQLPPTPNKLRLADGLANLSTEGDFGHDTLQEVATTLAETLLQEPAPDEKGQPRRALCRAGAVGPL